MTSCSRSNTCDFQSGGTNSQKPAAAPDKAATIPAGTPPTRAATSAAECTRRTRRRGAEFAQRDADERRDRNANQREQQRRKTEPGCRPPTHKIVRHQPNSCLAIYGTWIRCDGWRSTLTRFRRLRKTGWGTTAAKSSRHRAIWRTWFRRLFTFARLRGAPRCRRSIAIGGLDDGDGVWQPLVLGASGDFKHGQALGAVACLHARRRGAVSARPDGTAARDSR